METIKFWILFVTIPIIALLPDMTYYFIKRVFFPSPIDIILKKQKANPEFKYELVKKNEVIEVRE